MCGLRIFSYLSSFFFLLTISYKAFAQQPLILNHLSVEEGLSQSAVISIAQDKQGFMWFGTKDGLNKYNGNTFNVYRTSERENDYILALHASRNGDLWIGSKRGLRKYNPISDSFLSFDFREGKAGLQKSEVVNCIYEDTRGKVWVGTQKGLYTLNQGQISNLEKFSAQCDTSDFGEVYAIYQDKLKNIWIGARNGLFKINTKEVVLKYNFGEGADHITSITGDNRGNLWLAKQYGGIAFYDSEKNAFKPFTNNINNRNSLINNNVRKIIMDKNGQLWIGTLKGLNIFNPQTHTFTSYTHNIDNSFSLNQNSIYDIYQDRQGSVWIGTYYGGINVAFSRNTIFNSYQATNSSNSISSNVVSAILEDEKQNLWIGTEAEGLNYFDRKSKKFTRFKNTPGNFQSLSSNLVKSVYKDKKGNIWVGTYEGGLSLLNSDRNTFSHYKAEKGKKGALSSNNVSAILEDKKGRFWVGTMGGGLNLFDRKTQTFKIFTDTNKTNSLSSNWVKVLFEDSQQNIWIGSLNGLNLLRKGKGKFDWILQDSSRYGLKSNYINAITESADGYIWIGTTHAGLGKLDLKNRRFSFYNTSHGLISNTVYGIVEDDRHCLWLSTDKGLSKFDRQKSIFRNYTRMDGLPGNEFSTNSFLKTKSGEIFFGSLSGLISFDPAHIQESDFLYPTLFTGLKLFNRSVSVNDGSDILEKDICYTSELRFKHNQNTFTVEFAALNFIKSHKNRYAYKLENFDKDWNYTSSPLVTYTNLPPGEYSLLVKNANNDGVWNHSPSMLSIIVSPPFWKTWWAYFLYILFIAFVLYLVVKFLRERAKLERDLYYEHLENKRQQEFYQMKLDFFTNMSHELRTPLTLITGPLEKAIESLSGNQPVQGDLAMASKNARKLMQLVNELMDFRKAESGYMKLQASPEDLIDIAREIFSFFRHEAESKEIAYVFHSTESHIPVLVDRHQFEKVIFNLLSNAFKFVPRGGSIKVEVSVSDKFARFSVSDTGPGIPQVNQPDVFNNFYQAASGKNRKNSSGVGLALAKAITELHEGKISVKSDNLNGYHTEFTVELPLLDNHQLELITSRNNQNVSLPLTPSRNIHVVEVKLNKSSDKPILLLVEDNDEMRDFISQSVVNTYQILEARNGTEGLQLAKDHIPDIILSDVMMPEMDGLEFCKEIKSAEATAHIPVILLTARGEHEHQVDGLETGADVYITKPFSIKLLQLNMNNLLASREAMRQKFSKQIILEPQNLEISSPDEKFLRKVMAIIEEKMEDSQFGVAELIEEVAMSKNALYRKLNALTGLPPGDFIKSVRLKKAAAFLATGKFSVSEVTFSVGFNDAKYFGKEFKKYFGKSPTEYMNENRQPRLNEA